MLAVPVGFAAKALFGTEVAFVAIPLMLIATFYYPLKMLLLGFRALSRVYHLFFAKLFYSRSHPDIDFNSFSTSRLEKIIRLNARRKDVDAPRLDEDEINQLCSELDKKDLKTIGKLAVGSVKGTAKVGWWSVTTSVKIMSMLGINNDTSWKEKNKEIQERQEVEKIKSLENDYEFRKKVAREVELGIRTEANFSAGSAHEAAADARNKLDEARKIKS